jgi:acetate kinase
MSVVLVINPGCSSKKYGLYSDGRLFFEATYERTDDGYQSLYTHSDGSVQQSAETESSYMHSLSAFIHQAKERLSKEQVAITTIGIRVVASGSFFQQHQTVDDVYISRLRAQEQNAPLHTPVVLTELKQVALALPNCTVVAVSDTEWFSKLPPEAREYALPRDQVREYDIHRFGYHGLSASSAISRVHSVIGVDPQKAIVCHLGGGCSVTGVLEGRPVYTSSGFSTLSGVPMMSRAGDVDAGTVFHLLRATGNSAETVHQELQHNGGMKGLSGTEDLRILFDKKAQGNTEAAFALQLLANKLQQSIAAASISTGGIDALVLTGTIGYRSPTFRQLVTEQLGHFGIGIDEERNDLYLGKEGVISLSRSLAKVIVMRTDEMREIARVAVRIQEAKTSSSATI